MRFGNPLGGSLLTFLYCLGPGLRKAYRSALQGKIRIWLVRQIALGEDEISTL